MSSCPATAGAARAWPCAPLKVPEEIDKAVARRKLASMGVEIDEMNDVQREYLGI